MQQGHAMLGPTQPPPDILREPKEVWAFNLEDEMQIIQETAMHYPFVAVVCAPMQPSIPNPSSAHHGTVLPGAVAHPLGQFESRGDEYFQHVVTNVNFMDIVQVGITLMDERGNTPPKCASWQFNFKFDLDTAVYNQGTMEMFLRQTSLDRNRNEGVSPEKFASLLTCSGLVLSEDITWITFGGAFNIAHLLKILTGEWLPFNRRKYFDALNLYFPELYDAQHLAEYVKNLSGELFDVATQLQLQLPQWQGTTNAGVNSHLTGLVFFKMRDLFFEGMIEQKYNGVQYMLEAVTPPR